MNRTPLSQGLCPMDPTAFEKPGETFIAWSDQSVRYYGCSATLPFEKAAKLLRFGTANQFALTGAASRCL